MRHLYIHSILLLSLLAGGIGDVVTANFLNWQKSWPSLLSVVILGAIFILALVYLGRRFGWNFFISLPFIVIALIYVTVAIALGTVILQNLPIHEYAKIYGWFAKPILFLRLNDIFHSYWFAALLFMVNFSLVVYLVTHRMNRKNAAVWMIHLSLIIISLGGFVSLLTAQRGNLNMRIGEKKNTVQIYSRDRTRLKPHALPFAVKLHHFNIDYYPIQWRFYILNKKNFQYEIYDLAQTRTIEAGGAVISFLKKYENHQIKLRPVAAVSDTKCVRFALLRKDQRADQFWLDTGLNNHTQLSEAKVSLFLVKTKEKSKKLLSLLQKTYNSQGQKGIKERKIFCFVWDSAKFFQTRITDKTLSWQNAGKNAISWQYWRLQPLQKKDQCRVQEYVEPVNSKGPDYQGSFAMPIYKISISMPGKGKQSTTEKFLSYSKGHNTVSLSGDWVGYIKPKQNQPKNYHSSIGIYKNGQLIQKKKIMVNKPMRQDGYWIYQAHYNEQDLSYSGLLVVYDPGIYIVYIGLIFLGFAVAVHFILQSTGLGYAHK